MYPPPGQLGPRAIAAWGLRTRTEDVAVDGLAHIPATGPVLLVARHFHHLLDGSVLVMQVPRPVHIVVGLDWATSPFVRRAMETACRLADYPIVLRAPTVAATGVFRREEIVRYTRAALRDTTRLLRDGRVVLVFPEGYPTIDPAARGVPRTDDDWLPFAKGFLRMIAEAEADGVTRVALVPVGFRYRDAGAGRWSIRCRIGMPLDAHARDLPSITAAVRALSQPEPELR